MAVSPHLCPVGRRRRKRHSALVPLNTLDSSWPIVFKAQGLLIKLDVEGFELETLAGAAKTLNLTPRPTWLVEILLRSEVIPGGMSRKFAQTVRCSGSTDTSAAS